MTQDIPESLIADAPALGDLVGDEHGVEDQARLPVEIHEESTEQPSWDVQPQSSPVGSEYLHHLLNLLIVLWSSRSLNQYTMLPVATAANASGGIMPMPVKVMKAAVNIIPMIDAVMFCTATSQGRTPSPIKLQARAYGTGRRRG